MGVRDKVLNAIWGLQRQMKRWTLGSDMFLRINIYERMGRRRCQTSLQFSQTSAILVGSSGVSRAHQVHPALAEMASSFRISMSQAWEAGCFRKDKRAL